MARRPLSKSAVLIGTALLVAIALIAGCASGPEPVAITRVNPKVAGEKEVDAEGKDSPMPTPSPHQASGSSGDGFTVPMSSPYRVNHMIIKNAELKATVEDTAAGIDGVTQVAADTLGYILSSRTWYNGPFQYATITIGVPVHEFEVAMRRIRQLAVRVEDETASGTDVSDQYVSLESRLRNLEATEARIRAFLDKATSVEESLQINQKLSEITAQIEEVKGQMNYLGDRAAYSTITVHLSPQMPAPTPTPAPVATPDVWRPDETFKEATGVLGSIMRVIGDMAIWTAVVFGPFLLPAILTVWLVVWLQRRNRKSE